MRKIKKRKSIGLKLLHKKIYYLVRAIKRILRLPVYFARSYSSVPEDSWIIFPYHHDRISCGLISILEYKRKAKTSKDEYESYIARLEKLWPQMAQNNLNAIINGEINSANYMISKETLIQFSDTIMALKGIMVFEHIFRDQNIQDRIKTLINNIKSFIIEEENLLDKSGFNIPSASIEIINRYKILLKDCIWWLEKELLLNIEKLNFLLQTSQNNGSRNISNQLIREMLKIEIILNNLDRLEVRGRDSAGICIMIQFPDQQAVDAFENTLKEKRLYKEYETRRNIRDFINKSISKKGLHLFFIFKTAKKLGKLGDNGMFLRHEIVNDNIFYLALSHPCIYSQIIAHTRWASVGEITESNSHPLDNYSINTADKTLDIQINVVLNGDIDNYQILKKRLKEEDGIDIPAHITTDTKIIPLWVEHYLRRGLSLKDAFCSAVSDFEGSHAIALQTDKEPYNIYLAQKGSGQAVFIGIAKDCYIAASEVYGIVDQTPYYIKLDGEKERVPGEKKTKGQVFILNSKGGLEGLSAFYYDGFPVQLDKSLIKTAQITTRDIDRQGFHHYFLKEINESPESVKKTIRGKAAIVKKDKGKQVIFNLGEEILPQKIVDGISTGKIKYIYLVGQGTAGVAAKGIAMLISQYLAKTPLTVYATKASELSGFGLNRSLTDTLVIAVTQSGTTTDTNKAIDLARNYGAYTMAIVNRRDSDVTTKVEGVFYTSDGRDIEMSVASTKAFYSQIVAGCILGLCIAQILGAKSDNFITSELRELKRLPNLMKKIIREQKDKIETYAKSLSLMKQNWAVVGSGPNKVAADEIRIKLSELCYKTLPADVVEDRKHIDLASEPLIIVCAAGNNETVLGDVIKDTAIFKAHQATVVCIASEGEERFNGIADAVFHIPSTNERLAPVLNTIVGHLWGYFVAKAINDEADFFIRFKDSLDKKIGINAAVEEKGPEIIYDYDLQQVIKIFTKEFMLKKEAERFDGIVKPRTLCNLGLACKYAMGDIPLREMENDFGKQVIQFDPLNLLLHGINEMANQLSRPIDAIKHQAKTVTVGTSRLPATVSGVIFDSISKMGFRPSDLNPHIILTLRNVQPAIEKVNGATLYHITGLDSFGSPTENSQIRLLERYGITLQIPSRVEKDTTLRGTKRAVIKSGELFIGRGLWDNALIMIIPLIGKKEGEQYLTVFHISFFKDIPLDKKIKSMGIKYNHIIDMVNEWEIPWDDNLIKALCPEFLLIKSEEEIAEKIRDMVKSYKTLER